MQIYTYTFIVLTIFSNELQANAFLRAGNVFVRAARTGMQSFRSELSAVNKQSNMPSPEILPEAAPQILNLKNQQNIAQVLDVVTKSDRPLTINVIDAKHNKGSIGSTFVRSSTSSKKTEQKFDHSFNQEAKQNPSSMKYHEGHLVGVCAATLVIAEIAHYFAK